MRRSKVTVDVDYPEWFEKDMVKSEKIRFFGLIKKEALTHHLLGVIDSWNLYVGPANKFMVYFALFLGTFGMRRTELFVGKRWIFWHTLTGPLGDIYEGLAELMKPAWKQFIVDLGYTKTQGDAFAEGYATELVTLPPFVKSSALKNKNADCMTAGFKMAGIDENEVLRRFKGH